MPFVAYSTNQQEVPFLMLRLGTVTSGALNVCKREKVNSNIICYVNEFLLIFWIIWGGKPILYPICPEDPCGPKRTVESYNWDVETSKNTKDSSRGVKGASELSRLRFYEPVVNTNIDYMHSVLEGVVKRLLRAWFEDKVVGISIHRQVDKVNKRLLNIRPPSYMGSPHISKVACIQILDGLCFISDFNISHLFL